MRLESDAQTEFSVTRVVNLSADDTEGRQVVQAQGRIRRLEVIEHVRQLSAHGYPQVLLPTKVLGNRSVDIPTLEAAEVAPAAAVVVETQNAWAERRLDCCGVSEHIQPGSVRDRAVDGSHAAVQVVATEECPREAE